MSGLLESLGTLLSPLGTNVGLKNMLERCLAARTKAEEQWLMQDCLKLVKLKLCEPSTSAPVISKCLLFTIFSEMLGYKTDFAYIHAVNLAQNGQLHFKKIGYLACAVLLKPSDPLSVLLVNTVLRDLASRNIVIIAMALTASCHLFPLEQLPSLLPLLIEKLKHPSEYIRSKAIIVFHHFHRLCPEQCDYYKSQVCLLLGDTDPGVVALVLQFLLDIQNTPTEAEEIVPTLIKIQQQILDNKMPKDYVYHGVQAPWIQISILRLLGLSKIYNPEVQSLLSRTLEISRIGGMTEVMQSAIVCECLITHVALGSNDNFIRLAMTLIGELLTSNNNNICYEGLSALEIILKSYSISLSPSQQNVVLANLQHPDHSVKRKTLSLLGSIATASNARNICSQIADYTQTLAADDSYVRAHLVNKALALIEKFPDSQNYWHVAMLLRFLPLVEWKEEIRIQRLIKIVLMETDDTGKLDDTRIKVLRILGKYSKSKTASTSILSIYVWVLSRFSNLADKEFENEGTHCLDLIVQLGFKVLRNLTKDSEHSNGISQLLTSIIEAAIYFTEHSGQTISLLEDFIKELRESPLCHGHLGNICSELINSLPHLDKIGKMLKVETLRDQEMFDYTLSFLDDLVCTSLEAGEEPYQPQSFENHNSIPSLFDSQFTSSLAADFSSPTSSGIGSKSETHHSESINSDDILLPNLEPIGKSVRPLWTSAGRVKLSDEIESMTLNQENTSINELSNKQLASLVFGQLDNQTTEINSPQMPEDDEFDKLTFNIPDEKS